MTSNSHATSFGRMLILSVAAFRDNQIPAICFDKFDNVADFHAQILARIAIFDDACACEDDESPFYEPEWKKK